jgi:hypothetical protein
LLDRLAALARGTVERPADPCRERLAAGPLAALGLALQTAALALEGLGILGEEGVVNGRNRWNGRCFVASVGHDRGCKDNR